ncbi:helix-turn-helix transcriptional regulator [Mucilaginibacter sp. Bleaf8]|uniref:winged helix-turn-helix transcriptional regulator n=1 Tax=Mucilaginibacter sp. Bleaf8 TaxID=2834430 RepID=UPI001BCFBA9F|nr:helix-turn-helix domain-containing protein [Mucilaginibacter sp. Bleaf8]MBS7564750.1 helix-turn-helix transcriptional regulator [Mucilaginibacter sp. Bleaf8]
MKDQNFCNSQCPLTRAIGSIGNKWKPLIVHVIRRRTIRFGQISAHIPLITRKVLTEQLKELEEDGIVNRTAYKELPPRVEYALTTKGMALLPIVDQIQDWYVQFEMQQK